MYTIERTCRLFRVPLRLAIADCRSTAGRPSALIKYAAEMEGYLSPQSVSRCLTYGCNDTDPFPLKDTQPQDWAKQARCFDVMWLCVWWIEVLQSRNHVGDTLHAYESFKTTNYPSPNSISTCQALGSEERFVEAQSSYDWAKDTINLIVGFKAPCEILQEGLDVRRIQCRLRGA